MKRFFDIFVALSVLLILWPLCLLIALLVLFNLGPPILFKQSRPGQHGKPFIMYKFRTMLTIQDDKGDVLPDVRRLTKVGNFLRSTSIDELPELFNVIKGEMSLVGPRPLLMEYLPLYNREQARRHEVKPGITGWAQVNGRNAISWNDKFKLDVWYVDNQSLCIDIKILWLTIVKVFRREGISQATHATAEKFRGNA